MGSGAEGQTQAEVSAEPTALPRAQDLLWGLESLPGRALCPATLPKSSTAPGMSLEGMGWGVPGQRGDAREVILGSQQCWEKPWHNLTDPCLSQGWGNQPWSPPLPLLHPSVMGTSGSLTLFLLHPPFGDGLGFLPASFHFGRSVGREGKGKMVVVNPLLTTGLTRGMALPGAPKTPPPCAQLPGNADKKCPTRKETPQNLSPGNPQQLLQPLELSRRRNQPSPSAGAAAPPAPSHPGVPGLEPCRNSPIPRRKGEAGRRGDADLFRGFSSARPLFSF